MSLFYYIVSNTGTIYRLTLEMYQMYNLHSIVSPRTDSFITRILKRSRVRTPPVILLKVKSRFKSWYSRAVSVSTVYFVLIPIHKNHFSYNYYVLYEMFCRKSINFWKFSNNLLGLIMTKKLQQIIISRIQLN